MLPAVEHFLCRGSSADIIYSRHFDQKEHSRVSTREAIHDDSNVWAATNFSYAINTLACIVCYSENTEAVRLVSFKTSIWCSRNVSGLYFELEYIGFFFYVLKGQFAIII